MDANHGEARSQPKRCEKERFEVKGEQERVVLGLERGEVIDTVKQQERSELKNMPPPPLPPT